MVFGLFWSEKGYRFKPFWSEIWYAFYSRLALDIYIFFYKELLFYCIICSPSQMFPEIEAISGLASATF